MRTSVRLLIVVHDPVVPGMDPAEVRDLVDDALAPLLELLEAFPKVRLAVHPSGALLEALLDDRPGIVDALARLAARGQLDPLAGPYWGAPLHAVPEPDAIGQLRRHQRVLEEHLRVRPRGAWLPTGAWDPVLPRVLARAGIRYTFLDRCLVEAAGGEVDGGWGIAERTGAAVGIFALDRALSPPTTVSAPEWGEFLRGRAGVVATAWPLPALVEPAAVRAVLEWMEREAGWLRTVHGRYVIEGEPPRARVYPHAGTPPEVAEAALPAERARRLRRAWAAGALGLAEPCEVPPGPPFEAVLARHDVANRLHKRMLRASARVATLRRRAQSRPALRAAVAEADDHLHRGQAAAALHSGEGGRVLDPAVRHAAWLALLHAEATAHRALGEFDRLHHEVLDYDCDAEREVLVRNPALQAVVRPAAGGALAEFSLWGVGNLLNTAARRREAWHDDLALAERLPALVDADDLPTEEVDPLGPAPVLPLAPDMDRLLVPDRHTRLTFHDHFLGEATTLDNLRLGQYPEVGDFLDARYRLTTVERVDGGELLVSLDRQGTILKPDGGVGLVRVSKRYLFHPERALVRVEYLVGNRHGEPLRARFGVELNLNLDGRRGPGRRVEVPRVARSPLDRAGGLRNVRRALWVLDDAGIEVAIQLSAPAHLYHFPVEVPVRVGHAARPDHQATCLLFVWDAALWGGEQARIELRLEARARAQGG